MSRQGTHFASVVNFSESNRPGYCVVYERGYEVDFVHSCILLVLLKVISRWGDEFEGVLEVCDSGAHRILVQGRAKPTSYPLSYAMFVAKHEDFHGVQRVHR
jgi:hypothetical protein